MPPTEAQASPVTQMVIVAGGKGTRLGPAFAHIPKVLVPIGGKPVLQHQLECAAASGVAEVVIFAGHLADRIADFVGDGSVFSLRIAVRVEDKPMGNAGAVLQSLDALHEHFFVMYGDVMMAVDLARMARRHLAERSDFTIAVHPNDHPFDSDLIETDADGWVTAVRSYPHPAGAFFNNLVNAGLYVARREALRPLAKTQTQSFTTGMASLVAGRARVLAYRSTEYMKDMGTPERLRGVEADWNAGKIEASRSRRGESTVFLDRDGTLNVERGHLRRPEDLQLVPGAGASLRRLRQSGYRLVILTNQPVIARGEATESEVDAIHRKLEWELGKDGAFVDAVYLCPHHPDRGFPGERTELKIVCDCRKPNTGLLDRACADLRLDIATSWMIGDHARDIEMARRAGVRSILLTATRASAATDAIRPDYVARDLAEATDIILQMTGAA